ncbi:MAG: RDD family protein [Candidatus Hodarchaeales archaeon]|jgi:uncharacterized RDD family membrane protein YckC
MSNNESSVVKESQSNDNSKEIFEIASSENRFWAFIIDFILVTTLTSGVIGIASIVYGTPDILQSVLFYYFESGIFGIGTIPLASFVYFTIMEYFTNTTIGKSVMGMIIVDIRGNPPSFASIILNSVGKSFTLGFDVMVAICFLGHEENKVNLNQRLSQHFAKIVVIYTPKSSFRTHPLFINT